MRKLKIYENQLILPFNQRREGDISYHVRARIFWALVGITLISLVAYMYSINATARHIALRQNLERQITEISRGLDSLEFSYITLRNNVTLELAYEKGFKEVKSPLFVSRSGAQALTFNTIGN